MFRKIQTTVRRIIKHDTEAEAREEVVIVTTYWFLCCKLYVNERFLY